MTRLLLVPIVCLVLLVALVVILVDRSDDRAPTRVGTTSQTTVPPLDPAHTTGPDVTMPTTTTTVVVRLIPKARTAPTGVWDQLQGCECPPGWHCNTGNGYFGGLQMDMAFWRTYGGLEFAPRPDLASREQQIVVAERGRADRGYQPWPSCARRLGLIA